MKLSVTIFCMACVINALTASEEPGPWTNASPRRAWADYIFQEVAAQSKHDQRLKDYIKQHFPWEFFQHPKPPNSLIVKNLYWQKKVLCPLDIYCEFVDATAQIIVPLNETNYDDLIRYLTEQRDTQKAHCLIVHALRAQNILPELRKQIVWAFNNLNEQFKTDVLVMIRISARGDPQKNLPVHLREYYNQIDSLTL